MKMLSIIIKEIKHNLKSRKSLVTTMLFPIVLISVLGMALSGNFASSGSLSNSQALGSVNVLYANEGKEELSQSFDAFREKARYIGIAFTERENDEEALMEIKNRKYSGYVKITDNEIVLYKNDRYSIDAERVEASLHSFAQKYNLVSSVAVINPEGLSKLNESKANSYVKAVSLVANRTPRAVDYYSVTMLTLIIGYASMGGMETINAEKWRKTGKRILCSPISRWEMFAGKTIGHITICFLQYFLVILITKYVLKSYWGEHLGVVLAIVGAQTAMFISLGMMVANVYKNTAVSNQMLNGIVSTLGFLGGAYFPVDNLGKTMELVTKLSPLKWTNDAIFQVIYNNDFSSVGITLIISLGLTAVFISISALKIRKEAYIYE